MVERSRVFFEMPKKTSDLSTIRLLEAPRRGILAPMTEVSRLLTAIDAGDPQAASQLLPVVYDELRRLATAQLAHEKPGQC